MLDASSGSILLDGVDIRKATLKSLRRRVAVVPQDTCLFDESIRYNILYGAQDRDGNTSSTTDIVCWTYLVSCALLDLTVLNWILKEEKLQRAIESSNLKPTIAKLEQHSSNGPVGEDGAEVDSETVLEEGTEMRMKYGLGLDTVVGERGARLSGGERQKVAIARYEQ